MFPTQWLNGVRKLWNLIAGVFPGLASLEKKLQRRTHGPGTSDGTAAPGARGAMRSLLERFLWRNYAKDRVRWTEIPAESLPLLRVVLALALLLCVLLPVGLALPFPAIPVEGAAGPVAGWSVSLWLLSLSVFWGVLLAGAGNRLVLAAAAGCYLFFNAVLATRALPPSVFNALLPVTVLAAAWADERGRSRESRRARLAAGATLVAIGMAAGFFGTAVTPLKSVLGAAFPWSATGIGAALGAGLYLATRHASHGSEGAGSARAVLVRTRFWFVTAATLAFLLSVALRGGLAAVARGSLDFLVLWTGYLWPVWAFVGVGIIYKLLKHARTIASGIERGLPPWLIIPLTLTFIAAGFAVTWAPRVLDSPGLGWPAPVAAAAGWLYSLAAEWIWKSATAAQTADVLRWVFLLDLATALYLTLRRRWSARIALGMVFYTVFAWFLVAEYLFEYSAFAREAPRSGWLWLLLSVWVMWLLTSSGLDVASRDSPAWPRSGRLALFGATLLLGLLAIHARALAGDPLLSHEVFLYLFRGILDVGLPYFLYVYAGRTMGQLPLSPGRLLAVFAAGAALTIPLAVLDRLALAGWNASDMLGVWHEQTLAMLEGASMPAALSAPLPAIWSVLRGVLVLATLMALARVLRKRWGGIRPGSTYLLVLLTAALGVASFSKARIELPLVPLPWMLFISSRFQSLEIDLNLISFYLAWGLPAQILALAGFGEVRSRMRRAGALLLAIGVHALVSLGWPANEAWLRSTGTLWPVVVLLVSSFLLLLRRARDHMDGENPPDQPQTCRVAAATSPWLIRCAIGAAVLCLGWCSLRGYGARLLERHVEGTGEAIAIPAFWASAGRLPSGAAAFLAPTWDAFRPMLLVETMEAQTASEALQSRLAESVASGAKIEILRWHDWSIHAKGVMAVDFSIIQTFPDGGEAPLVGTAAAVPGQHRLWILTVIGTLSDWQERRYDLVRMAGALR